MGLPPRRIGIWFASCGLKIRVSVLVCHSFHVLQEIPLSQIRLISAWQCSKKLYLKKHDCELAVITAQVESSFAGGHQVGDSAQVRV